MFLPVFLCVFLGVFLGVSAGQLSRWMERSTWTYRGSCETRPDATSARPATTWPRPTSNTSTWSSTVSVAGSSDHDRIDNSVVNCKCGWRTSSSSFHYRIDISVVYCTHSMAQHFPQCTSVQHEHAYLVCNAMRVLRSH